MARAISATCPGSCRSKGPGSPCGTAQNPQVRVQVLPKIMKVAVPREKHSCRLGQRADSQTVCRLRWRSPAFSSWTEAKSVAGLRSQDGNLPARSPSGAAPI